MRRKDCEQSSARVYPVLSGGRWRRLARAARMSLTLCFVGAASPQAVRAGTIRLWANAVATGDTVRLDDIAEVRGFDEDSARRIGGTTITDSPAPGGSRVIEIAAVRAALTAHRVNLGSCILSGASRCELSRPASIAPTTVGRTTDATSASDRTTPRLRRHAAIPAALSDPAPDAETLRQSVIAYFTEAVRRYNARAEVAFDGVSDSILELAAPTYSFRVRNASRQLVGLVPVEVDVRTGDRIVQTIPMSVRLTVLRDTIVARRTINQDATLQTTDVELAPMSLSRFDDLPANDLSQVVGQRAKRVIPAGAVIDAGVLEAVPLILRGQLVTLVSEVGGVRVVTAGKAAEDGRLGEVIRVRSTDRRQAEFDAVVTGPGQARVSQEASASRSPRTKGDHS